MSSSTRRLRRAGALALTGLVVGGGLLASPARAQVTAFDGRYAGESIRCFPSTGPAWVTDITVRSGAFAWTAKEDYRTVRCTVTVDADGRLRTSPDCSFRITGSIVGPRLTMVQKTDFWECTIVGTRRGPELPDDRGKRSDG